MHDGDRRAGQGDARVEGGDRRVVPAGDLPEEDGREDPAGQAEPGARGKADVVGDALGGQGVGHLGDRAALGGGQLAGVHGHVGGPKLTCRALIAAMPALLPAAE